MNKFILLAFLALSNSAFGQYAEHYEKKALTSFHSKDYSSALVYSEKAIEMEPDNVGSLFLAGESARLLDELDKAEDYLEKIPEEAKAGFYAVTDYALGTVKHDLSKTEEAARYYEQYLAQHNHQTDLYAYLAKQALDGIAAGEKSRRGKDVELDRLGDNINSDLAELAPLRYAGKLYFTSVEEENFVKKSKRGKKVEQRPVTRIYEAQLDRPARESAVNPKKASVNASNVALMPDASKMYYTLCKDDDYHGQQECEIWCRERQYEGHWGPPVRLPEHINLRGYSSTQPSIGYDKNLRRFVLYFVSDRPGGVGGQDIWASALDWGGTTYGEPFLLPFNSAGDEVTPFYHQLSQTLFFSSEGFGGSGGLDVLRAKKDPSGNWGLPENLGGLLNSKYDDLYYTYHSGSGKAYFVSDRPGSNCKDEKNRNMDCRDIYQARIFVELDLEFFSASGKTPVRGAVVKIEDLGTGKFGEFAASQQANRLNVKLEPGRLYRVIVNAGGHQSKTMVVNTEGHSSFEILKREVLLDGLARP